MLKGQQIDSELDTASASAENLNSILPNFLWVVRDFSLQLEDETGAEITAKQYLENALS